MRNERELAGLRCGEVLARLSDYLDGSLAGEERTRMEAHVAGCDHCARFGGVFAATVAGLRRRLARPAALSAARRERLTRRLTDETG